MRNAAAEAGLSLGSNLGDKRGHLARALRVLADGLLVDLEVSSLWEGEPVEVPDEQPEYLNLCAVGRTALDPQDLLRRCQALEREAGREPGGHRLPRSLDIDLLYHDGAAGGVLSAPELKLPHPGLARRRFVLAPLAELRPRWRHPLERKSAAQLLAELGEAQALSKVVAPKDWWRHG